MGMPMSLFCAALLLSSCFAPVKMATKEQMLHQRITQVQNKSRAEIFDKTLKWVSLNFKSGKEVIDYQNRETGSIIAKGIIPNVDYGAMVRGNLHFTLSIDIKEDGKMRFDYGSIQMLVNWDGVHEIGDTEGVHEAARREFALLNEAILASVSKSDDF